MTPTTTTTTTTTTIPGVVNNDDDHNNHNNTKSSTNSSTVPLKPPPPLQETTTTTVSVSAACVLLETTLGDLVIDMPIIGTGGGTSTCPTAEENRLVYNFLQLCRVRYYTKTLINTIVPNRFCQLGCPIGNGTGGTSIYGLLDYKNDGNDENEFENDMDDNKSNKNSYNSYYIQSSKRFIKSTSAGRPLTSTEKKQKGCVVMKCIGTIPDTIGSQFIITTSSGTDNALDGYKVISDHQNNGMNNEKKKNDNNNNNNNNHNHNNNTNDSVDFDTLFRFLGYVVEDKNNVLDKINSAYIDENGRPYADIRIERAIIVYDPFQQQSSQSVINSYTLQQYMIQKQKIRFVDNDATTETYNIDSTTQSHNDPTRNHTIIGQDLDDRIVQSPSPIRPIEEIVPLRVSCADLFHKKSSKNRSNNNDTDDDNENENDPDDDDDNDDDNRIVQELNRYEQQVVEEADTKSRAVVLEMLGDLPDASIKAPDNVLFICKLNSSTIDEDLQLILSRFDENVHVEIIKDYITGASLQYAFAEFTTSQQAAEAYFKMNNALIDDRRIRVDFSQSVAKLWDRYNQRMKKKQPQVQPVKQQQQQQQQQQYVMPPLTNSQRDGIVEGSGNDDRGRHQEQRQRQQWHEKNNSSKSRNYTNNNNNNGNNNNNNGNRNGNESASQATTSNRNGASHNNNNNNNNNNRNENNHRPRRNRDDDNIRRTNTTHDNHHRNHPRDYDDRQQQQRIRRSSTNIDDPYDRRGGRTSEGSSYHHRSDKNDDFRNKIADNDQHRRTSRWENPQHNPETQEDDDDDDEDDDDDDDDEVYDELGRVHKRPRLQPHDEGRGARRDDVDNGDYRKRKVEQSNRRQYNENDEKVHWREKVHDVRHRAHGMEHDDENFKRTSRRYDDYDSDTYDGKHVDHLKESDPLHIRYHKHSSSRNSSRDHKHKERSSSRRHKKDDEDQSYNEEIDDEFIDFSRSSESYEDRKRDHRSHRKHHKKRKEEKKHKKERRHRRSATRMRDDDSGSCSTHVEVSSIDDIQQKSRSYKERDRDGHKHRTSSSSDGRRRHHHHHKDDAST